MSNGSAHAGKGPAISLLHDPWGRLVLIDEHGKRHVGVEPVRAFPLSDPAHWVSLCDPEGHEVCFVESLADLPAPVRQVLEEELASREFVPVIRCIVRSSGPIFPTSWDVETDRGPTRLELDSEDDLRRSGKNRILITDARRSRYIIPDTRALDAHSRRILERHV